MTQVVVRLSDELTAKLDEHVASGQAASRSAALRDGLERLLDDARRADERRRTIEGYTRFPQTEDEAWGIDASTREMIEAEPW